MGGDVERREKETNSERVNRQNDALRGSASISQSGEEMSKETRGDEGSEMSEKRETEVFFFHRFPTLLTGRKAPRRES